ncbi:hypothetical protein Htur_0394 [Haloterrigena turkmenica DSM 5511]|uniref:Uncharacterized protein n=1 Tax=Haloterrigena turkmenica (strain ATCC 51198 / DSM 5511 / JCM 9101 / NCIMB 13204 / VKM B-1734 / 4k) TaxID=543526 RepID=D2RV01_HALTV|nr:hypothetical protein [Haloterrigena turkmenica]ADB59294.1 hypothetical protein Htur_0394 [Haloterrigena turkmenica DSM 5511]
MAVTLPAELLSQYQRFSLYNSPYPAHDEGCAVDLYPGTLRDGRTSAAPSPVSGTVRETRDVKAPPKPYAPEHDHLILIDCDGPGDLEGLTARILHVQPTVEAGDRVERGDSLGELVRAGFFAPWVDNHLHVGLRRPDQNPHRASGSIPLEVGVELRPLEWDGTGTVVATGATYAVLDAPAHPDPGEAFVGVRADDGGGPNGVDRKTQGVFRDDERAELSRTTRRSSSERRSDGGVLDGGLPHYDGGGLLASETDGERVVSLNGDRLGVARGRTITWDDVVVTVNDEPITGLSLFCARDADFGAKLICPDRPLEIGQRVRVRVRPSLERE